MLFKVAFYRISFRTDVKKPHEFNCPAFNSSNFLTFFDTVKMNF